MPRTQCDGILVFDNGQRYYLPVASCCYRTLRRLAGRAATTTIPNRGGRFPAVAALMTVANHHAARRDAGGDGRARGRGQNERCQAPQRGGRWPRGTIRTQAHVRHTSVANTSTLLLYNGRLIPLSEGARFSEQS